MYQSFQCITLSTSESSTKFLYSLRYTANPFEWTYLSSTGITLSTPLLLVSPTTKATYRLITLLMLFRRLLLEALWFSQVPMQTFSSTRHDLRPRHADMHSPCRTYRFRLQTSERPSPNGILLYFGAQYLHAFALRLADCPTLSFI